MKSFSTVLSTISQLNSEYTLVRDYLLAKKLFHESMSKLNPIIVKENSVIVRAYRKERGYIKYLTIKISLSTDINGKPLVTVEYL